MVLTKKHLIVFGGFHDNLRECKYFNDVHAFDLDNLKWKKLEVSGSSPAPRSACNMFVLPDGRIVVFAGYAKEKGKKDSESGITYSDMFVLSPDSKLHPLNQKVRHSEIENWLVLRNSQSKGKQVDQNKIKLYALRRMADVFFVMVGNPLDLIARNKL